MREREEFLERVQKVYTSRDTVYPSVLVRRVINIEYGETVLALTLG